MEAPPLEHPPLVGGVPDADTKSHLILIIPADVSSSVQHLCCIQKAALQLQYAATSILNIHYQIYLTFAMRKLWIPLQ